MTQRTCNIIGLCKSVSQKYSNSSSIKNNIARYMAYECGIDYEYYTDEQIDDIIMDAFLDFVDGVDMPSLIIKQVFFNSANKHFSSV